MYTQLKREMAKSKQIVQLCLYNYVAHIYIYICAYNYNTYSTEPECGDLSLAQATVVLASYALRPCALYRFLLVVLEAFIVATDPKHILQLVAIDTSARSALLGLSVRGYIIY